MTTVTGRGKPPFIYDQGIDLLIDRETPRRRLRPEAFRGQRLKDQNSSQESRQGGPDEDDDEKFWKPLSREQLVRGNVEIAGGVFPLHRVVLTTDAGIGKTINMKWLTYALNVEWPEQTAVFLLATQLTAGPDKLIESVLVDAWFDVCGVPQHERAQKRDYFRYALEQRLRRGRLILVIDGLDHVSDSGPVGHLQTLLTDPSWRQCRVFLSGRPHALHRYWEELFEDPQIGWSFLRLQEFTPEQQERFLGKELYKAIPEEARRILSVPRVLHYIREFLPEDELRNLKTPSDVYHKSVRHMIHEGMLRRPKARRFGRPPSASDPDSTAKVDVDGVLQLLAGVAFQMTSTQLERDRNSEGDRLGKSDTEPNFNRVDHGQFQAFQQSLCRRIPRYRAPDGESQLRHDLECLDALNSGLSYGIFDVDQLNVILWRDRSLQEFFTAYWMSNYFDGSYVDDLESGRSDAELLHDWLPLAHEPLTQDYYSVWRHATEMPDGARSNRVWLNAMQPLFQPGDQQPGPVKRATEMIYRCWNSTLRRCLGSKRMPIDQTDCVPLTISHADRQLARSIVQGYQAEVQRIRLGSDGPRSSGSGLGAFVRQLVRRIFSRRCGVARRILAETSYVTIPPDDIWRSRGGVLELGAGKQLTVASQVRLARTTVTNAEYELFDRSHKGRRWRDSFLGPEGDCHPDRGANGKGDDRCPVVNASFYDAWAYCLWLGPGYKLPTSEEWQYACRAGTTTAYSFGDEEELLGEYAWYEQNSEGRTHPVGEKRPNPWGLYDMHGNVWEWCDSWYTRGVYRVDRGGSWGNEARSCRSVIRDGSRPGFRDHYLGFRVAQVPSSQESQAK